MGCATCSTGGCGSKSSSGVAGCGSKGNCSCNRLNTFDWLSNIDLPTLDEFNIVEVSFKNGSRKGFYLNPGYFKVYRGEDVVVESGTGFDVGRVSLTGELVKLQMKKKRFKDPALVPSIIRRANDRDLERLENARQNEPQAMVRARVIARDLKLDMKIGDVEYQGDKRKATFYYTADGRVDFRELIKLYAKEFRVKIEMRQIGARQESARIGGIGSCGRELCCSTWLSDFKSVSTAAARYQNLAINQAKLSGQCGRLKCCLNFELDSYMDALEDFPDKADKLETEAGLAVLMKTDIFKKTMYYTYKKEGFSKIYALDVRRVKEILAMNRIGKKPMDLAGSSILEIIEDEEPDFGDVTGSIELADLDKHKKSRKRNRSRNRKKGNSNGKSSNDNKTNAQKTSTNNKPNHTKTASNKNSNHKSKSNPRSNKPQNKNNDRTNKYRKQQGDQRKEQPKSRGVEQSKPDTQKAKTGQEKPKGNQNRNRSKDKFKPNDKKGSGNARFKKERSNDKPKSQSQKPKNQTQNTTKDKPNNSNGKPGTKKPNSTNNKANNKNRNRNSKRRFNNNNRNNNSNNNNNK